MTLPLAEWDEKIGPHLQGIESGADICLRHVHQLVFRPDFDTIAFDDLVRTEKTLAAALAKIQNAIRLYSEAPPHG